MGVHVGSLRAKCYNKAWVFSVIKSFVSYVYVSVSASFFASVSSSKHLNTDVFEPREKAKKNAVFAKIFIVAKTMVVSYSNFYM